MLVDYVRVYQVEGQSIVVAEPREETSSGGGAFSTVTALSVLVVLGVLFTLCLVSGLRINVRTCIRAYVRAYGHT